MAERAERADRADRADGLRVRLQQQAPIPLACQFDCAPGELVALVGPSGSGKTTVLRCIAGLVHAQKGHIRCGEASWFDAAARHVRPPQQRRVGFVFQHYALLPHLSALENVALGLGELPPVARLERAAEWLARVHLAGLEQRKPAALSGGQQQRVALARALARATASNNSGVLLLDEPFAAVDQVTRGKLRTELARLRHELDIPMVLVTHDLDEARQLADRMVVLHRGSSLQEGTPEQLLTQPRNPAVARLMGLTNLFSGVVAGNAATPQLHWNGRRLSIVDFCGFAPGDAVSWVIPPEGVLLHRPDRPSQGDAENPVTGTLRETLRLGSFTQVTLEIFGEPQPLTFAVSTRAIERNGLAPGSIASATLLAQRIHLMPA